MSAIVKRPSNAIILRPKRRYRQASADTEIVYGPPITIDELRSKACDCATCAMMLAMAEQSVDRELEAFMVELADLDRGDREKRIEKFTRALKLLASGEQVTPDLSREDASFLLERLDVIKKREV